MLDRAFIGCMIDEAARRKTGRIDVRRVVENKEHYIDVIYNMMQTESYVPHMPRATVITEGTRPKNRTIRKIRFFDQIIHHMAINSCMEVLSNGMYTYCCGSVPHRGTQYAQRHIERWLRTDRSNTKYCAQMDIHHFFDSVDHDVLKGMLSKKIADERMLHLLFIIIDSCPDGLPLGYFTSQWLANFMLQDLDHIIKEQLHIKHYVRYMDDIILFSGNKKQLHKAVKVITEYLESIKLTVKGNYQVFRMEYTDRKGKHRGRALDFLGYRYYRDHTELRKSLMLRMTRTAKRIGKKQKPTYYDATVMLSYMGWIDSSDTYNVYLRYVKPYIDIKQLKKIVSKKSKERNGAKNGTNQMAERHRNAGDGAAGRRQDKQPKLRVSAQEHYKSGNNERRADSNNVVL